MAYDKFLIAPINSGLVNNLPTWQTPEDSFKVLENAHIHRGTIRKRFGTKFSAETFQKSTLSYNIGTTDSSGNLSGTIPGTIFGTIGQFFSVGTQLFTVHTSGTPVTMLKSSGSGSATYDTTSGAYSFSGVSASTTVYWYPTLPVLGITHYEKGEISEHVSYAFDRQFIYKFDGDRWIKDSTFTGPFHGSNSDFFWSTNFVGVTSDQIALFVTNYNVTESGTPSSTDDVMYYYNGTNWADFSAKTVINSSGDNVESAKMIINWKNRLLLLNVVEQSGGTNKHYQSRIRYSHQGSPLSTEAWLERNETYSGSTANGAGYIDLPIEESIVSAKIVKDRLIVFAERSTYELAYTGNAARPFFWRGLDASSGSIGRFSTVDIGDAIVTISQEGIVATNGASVDRIDVSVPDISYDFDRSVEGAKEIQAIVDTHSESVYWTYNPDGNNGSFASKILVYNYKNNTWSHYYDTITCFGFFEQSSDRTWDIDETWDSSDSWGTYLSLGDSRDYIAGNHKGVISIIDSNFPKNVPSLPVANVAISGDVATLTIENHNLADGSYVYFDDDNISFDCDGIFKVNVVDDDTIKITDQNFAGSYLGGGTCRIVSVVKAQTKEFNPYIKFNYSVFIPKASFCVTNTTDGELFVDYEVDNTDYFLASISRDTGANLGTNVLEMHAYDSVPFEKVKQRLWRDVFFQAKGDSVSFLITLTESQILDKNIIDSPFEIQGILIYAMRA